MTRRELETLLLELRCDYLEFVATVCRKHGADDDAAIYESSAQISRRMVEAVRAEPIGAEL